MWQDQFRCRFDIIHIYGHSVIESCYSQRSLDNGNVGTVTVNAEFYGKSGSSCRSRGTEKRIKEPGEAVDVP